MNSFIFLHSTYLVRDELLLYILTGLQNFSVCSHVNDLSILHFDLVL